MIEGKTIVITGAANGIGRALAEMFFADGAKVIACDKDEEKLLELDKQGVTTVIADVSDPKAVESFINLAVQETGKLDALFNNAGMGAPPVPLEDLTFEQWSNVVAVNLTGSFLCTQEAFKLMKNQNPQGCRIINNGSVSAHAPRPFSSPYTSTKHAITGLTKSTSLDGRQYNIACGQIDIGNAATDMTARMKNGVPQANGETMVEPTMDVDNVSQAILYMASRPPDANAQFLTIMATKMPYLGRG